MTGAGKLVLSFVLSMILAPLWEAGAHAGCQVTFQGRNGSTSRPYQIVWPESQVRIRIGTWKKLGTTGTTALNPGQTFSQVLPLDFGCNVDRRYRFSIVARPGSLDAYVKYYPSPSSFTRNTVIDLGDVNRYFPP